MTLHMPWNLVEMHVVASDNDHVVMDILPHVKQNDPPVTTYPTDTMRY